MGEGLLTSLERIKKASPSLECLFMYKILGRLGKHKAIYKHKKVKVITFPENVFI